MTSEALQKETEIDISELDSREFSKLDRETLEKLLSDLANTENKIRSENRDRQSEIARLQSEVNDQGGKLPQISHLASVAQKAIDKRNVEEQLLQDVKDLRPLCDRINSLSRQLYDELAAYLSEVDRVQKLQRTVNFKAEFKSNIEVGDLPVIEFREGFERFELKSVDAASYQRQNRTSAFQDSDFGFAAHQYRPKN